MNVKVTLFASLMLATSCGALQAASVAKTTVGPWTVTGSADAFETHRNLQASAEAEGDNGVLLVIRCNDQYGFRLSLFSNVTAFPKTPAALILVKADEQSSIPLEGVSFGAILEVNRAEPAQEAILGASRIGVRVKVPGYKDRDVFFTFKGLDAGRAQITKTCPPNGQYKNLAPAYLAR